VSGIPAETKRRTGAMDRALLEGPRR